MSTKNPLLKWHILNYPRDGSENIVMSGENTSRPRKPRLSDIARECGVSLATVSRALSQPGLAERAEATARGTAGKAWRFVGEMKEIASTFEAARLPGDFHRGAAEVYDRMAGLKQVDEVTMAEVLAHLLGERVR